MTNYLLSLVIILSGWLEGRGQSSNPDESYLVTKSRAYTSINFSLDQRNAQNENQLLRYVIDQNRLNYNVRLGGGYVFKNNLAAGLVIGFGSRLEEVTYEDQDGQLITTNSSEQGAAIVPTFRTYVPLGKGRLQILVQTELGFIFGETLQRNFLVDDVEKITGNFFEAQLGVSPGAIIFFNRHWAFETTVGLAGFYTRVEEQVSNNDEDNRTRIVESGIDLRLNLLQLNLGVAYYF